MCFWTNPVTEARLDDFDWIRQFSYGNFGPRTDHTKRTSLGYFMSLNGDHLQPKRGGTFAWLISGEFTGSSVSSTTSKSTSVAGTSVSSDSSVPSSSLPKCMSFYYYMYQRVIDPGERYFYFYSPMSMPLLPRAYSKRERKRKRRRRREETIYFLISFLSPTPFMFLHLRKGYRSRYPRNRLKARRTEGKKETEAQKRLRDLSSPSSPSSSCSSPSSSSSSRILLIVSLLVMRPLHLLLLMRRSCNFAIRACGVNACIPSHLLAVSSSFYLTIAGLFFFLFLSSSCFLRFLSRCFTIPPQLTWTLMRPILVSSLLHSSSSSSLSHPSLSASLVFFSTLILLRPFFFYSQTNTHIYTFTSLSLSIADGTRAKDSERG